MVIAIGAMTTDGIIGYQNKLPWKIASEGQHFKQTTDHYPVLFGRKTFDFLPVKPLPGRKNIVLTRNQNLKYSDYSEKSVKIITSLQPYINSYSNHPTEHIFICGGASIYRASWPLLDKLIISVVHGVYKGDTYFPEDLDWSPWELVKTIHKNEFTIYYYERKI